MKVHCPFGDLYHSDQGIEAAFRIYPGSNSAFCFAGCGYFTPVGLAAMAWDRPKEEVAADLLDRVGYKPVSLAQAWAGLQVREEPPDTAMLALALRTYCERVAPGWAERQFEPGIGAVLDRCLALLPRVKTPDDAEQWLQVTKRVMCRTLVELGQPSGYPGDNEGGE